MFNKKAQVTIFIIIAIVIIGGLTAYLLIRSKSKLEIIDPAFSPIFNYYSSCIEDAARAAADLTGSQGGRIYISGYETGSEYAPFSSQLNFLGFNIPYWYYVAGNGIIKEQVPSKQDIEKDISLYVKEKISDCDFESFYRQGFSIELGNKEVNINLEDNKIKVNVEQDITITKDDKIARKIKHEVEFESKLGNFYNLAKEIYDKEKNEAFLENYAVDVLRLYAPVDGAEISCSPKIWKTREVIDDLKTGLENNVAKLKLKGNYYSLKEKKDEYFVINKETNDQVNFIYNPTWPSKIEVIGADEELMMANPIGNQAGLGAMGFCYAPYHFVYDLSFPVLIQIFDGNEIFQFPIAVIIDNNVPREAIFSETEQEENVDLCSFKAQDIEVNVYDINLNKINKAQISYECFDKSCNLGETDNGKFTGKTPVCINGFISAKAEGFAEKKQIFSSNTEISTDIILDKEYDLYIELEVGNKPLKETAIVSFDGQISKTLSLPETNNIKLSEGLYNISVYVYGNSSVTIPESTKTQCTQVSSGGIAGLFGSTKEQCFDIKIPSTKIEYALIGGGVTEHYLLANDLEKGKIKLKVPELGRPDSLEKLQYNYELFDKMGVEIEFQ
ncbi:hypothetical protein HYW75_00615 [Candidatus Pacearchaeota archaeon]|nr:hypothetical protein [Candidatus Pacearchaeota archaeon]